MSLARHSRESGNPSLFGRIWPPAFAGVTSVAALSGGPVQRPDRRPGWRQCISQARLADCLSLSTTSLWSSKAWARFRKNAAFFAPSGVRLLAICAQYAHNLQPSKSHVLLFKVLLEFVPTIFVFPRDPPDSSRSDNFEPCRIPPVQNPRRNECGVQKLGLRPYFTHLSTQLGFVLSSF